MTLAASTDTPTPVTGGLRATVAAVDVVEVTPEIRPELVIHAAAGVHDRSPFALVRVRTSDGVAGYGEVTATPGWSGEDGATAAHLIRTLVRPALVGQPLAPVAALAARIDLVLAGSSFTKAGVSTALWDALGRTLGVPVATLLGGPHRTVVPVKMSLSGGGDQLESAYSAAYDRGFRAFKLKVGFDPREDAARFAHCRRLVGAATFLGADANQGWSRAAAALALDLMREDRPAFFEQPVRAGDLEGMRSLRGTGVPVLADESVFSMDDLTRLVRADAADLVSVYVGKSGGLERAVAQARVASAFGLQSIVGSNMESDIGAAAQVHVACAIEGLSAEVPSDICGPLYYREPTAETPLDLDGRRVVLPDAPGLGVVPRADIEERFA